MIAFAEAEFALTRPTADGATEGDHRQSGAAQLEKLPPSMRPKSERAAEPKAEPDRSCPEPLRYIWSWFIDILNGCASSGFGPLTVTWRDLQAWSAMTGNSPQPWEVDALMRLGATFVNVRSNKDK